MVVTHRIAAYEQLEERQPAKDMLKLHDVEVFSRAKTSLTQLFISLT